MSVHEPTRGQLDAAERLALSWASVRCEPLTEGSGLLHVTVTSFRTAVTRGGYTARATRQFELAIDEDGEIVSGVIA